MSSGSSHASGSLSSGTSPGFSNVKLPITSIPDMRFEQSYLASIRGFVHEVEEESAEEMKEERQSQEERLEGNDDGSGSNEKHKAPRMMASRSPRGEPELWIGSLRIQWWPLLYLTVRDQIFSPIIQGAVFGVGGLALSQLRTYLAARRQTGITSTGTQTRRTFW